MADRALDMVSKDPNRVARRSERGFTLLELLVALVIAGVLIGVATLSLGAFDRGLHFEVDRLAQLLSLAREEALVRGAPIRFESDGQQYRFLILRERRWQVLRDDRDLRERDWAGPVRIALERADGGASVEFGREHVDVPFRLLIERGGERVQLDANGLGRFDLH